MIRIRPALALLTLSLLAAASAKPTRLDASDPGSGDWPMWGGTADRNMVSIGLNPHGVPGIYFTQKMGK